MMSVLGSGKLDFVSAPGEQFQLLFCSRYKNPVAVGLHPRHLYQGSLPLVMAQSVIYRRGMKFSEFGKATL